MWRLKIGEGRGEDNPYLKSTNNFAGRQIWEFDPTAGTAEERVAVEETRRSFYDSRHRVKACGDLLWRMQVRLIFLIIVCSIQHKCFPYFFINLC